ncbi:MAG: hypothetical protein P8Z33_15080 [Gammaproteobacteria bacterium]
MVLRKAADQQSSLEARFERRRFTRRPDLTNNIRLTIAANALHAMMNGVWGAITRLADEYEISRPFVYSLADTLKEAGQFLFGEMAEFVPASSPRERSIQMMLSLRMEARSSVSAISTVMRRFAYELPSTGSISQILSRIGGWLPTTLSTENGIIRYLVFASDEIFSKTTPILVTVDPCSSAILRIELAASRKAEDWKRHFECLYDNGVEAIYLVSDEGKGIRTGHAAVMSDGVRQSDTYHAIAHQAVTLYDDFSYLYGCVLGELNVFDRNGNLRDRQQAEEGVQVGLALVEGLNHNTITEAVHKIRRTLPDLFHYFDVAAEVVNECRRLTIDEETLKAYCIAWQWGKAVRKAKRSDRKKRAQEQEQLCLEIAGRLHQESSEDIQKKVYSKLDTIVQSSALVECINSIIRPYLNTTKNHVTQELLNLIMHYHNHRRYSYGVRKGKTPMEILTGKKQAKDWISTLLDIIREKDPQLLLAS